MADSIFSKSEPVPDLFCTDYDRCLTFYRDTLGLEVEELPEMPGNAVLRTGRGGKILLHSSDHSGDDHTAMSFLSDDFGETIDLWRSKGVKFEDYDNPGFKTVDGVATLGSFKAAWFKDPGGNILCVSPSLEVVKKAA